MNIFSNISNCNHEQCIRSNKIKGGGTHLYIHNAIQYKKIIDLSQKNYKHVLILLLIN